MKTVISTFGKFLSSNEFRVFVTFFVLFVIFSPGMVVEIDSLSDFANPSSDIETTMQIKNVMQTLVGMIKGKVTNDTDEAEESVNNVSSVLIHGALVGILAATLLNVDYTMRGKNMSKKIKSIFKF